VGGQAKPDIVIRSFRLLLALGLLLAPLAVGGQPAANVRRIGYLSPGGHDAGAQLLSQAFRQGLSELGWVEGQNVAIEWRYAGPTRARLAGEAAELVRLGADVLLTVGELATEAARDATSTIPIVMAVSADPVGSGFIESLARPGGNITGLSLQAADLGRKRLQLLKDAVPRVSRVALLCNVGHPGKAGEVRNIQGAAESLGVVLQPVGVRASRDFDGAFVEILKARADALVVLWDPLTHVHQGRIVDFAVRNRLPMMSESGDLAVAGGLMAYGANVPDLFRRAAYFVHRILKGARPADLPVEQATKFDLVINLRAAKRLALDVPPSLRLRADLVIE